MNYHSHSSSEDDSPPHFPSPPPHIFFPTPIFSPLIFGSNSPLSSPSHQLRSNPFDSPIPSTPFEQRSNLFDPYTHDHPPPQPPRSLSPIAPVSDIQLPQKSPRGLCIDLPDVCGPLVIEDVRPPPATHVEWLGAEEQDINFEDEGLSALERIYLFCRSKAVFHRVFIAHALPTFLPQVAPQDAVEYVIPLLSGLAMDEEEAVKEALATELVTIIWWFLINCRVASDEEAIAAATSAHFSPPTPPDLISGTTLISVQTFTPILGTLLLSPNGIVGGSARGAVVELLRRIKLTDGKDGGAPRAPVHQLKGQAFGLSISEDTWQAGKDEEWPVGLFQSRERGMFEAELLHQVVIGMGRLDMPEQEEANNDGLTPGGNEPRRRSPLLTPNRQPLEKSDSYFPSVTPNRPSSRSPPQSTNLKRGSPTPQSDIPLTPRPQVTGVIIDSPQSEGSTPELSPAESEGSSKSPPDLWYLNQYSPPSGLEVSPSFEMVGSQVRRIHSEGSDECNWPSETANEKVLHRSPPGEHSFNSSPPPHYLEANDRGFQSEWPGADRGIEGDEYHGVGYNGGETLDQMCENDESEQAAVGRLSSMSLIAAVAASGSLADDMKSAFVKEVQRVGRDPVFWVRREASYALGALAKVVAVEIVVSSLLPLMESLCHDTVWHVRHSALFALPAILSRLAPSQRRTLALSTMLSLSEDTSSSVRIGVLEALGEVLYTFHGDERNVPGDLLNLFIGQQTGREKGNEPFDAREQPPWQDSNDRWPEYPSWVLDCSPEDHSTEQPTNIWNDPARPLICAFNYPAVALTLGRERWSELRDLYRDLSHCPQVKVRRTLAASLGELAKIIGAENAKKDLMDVFKASIKAEEGEVRTKAVEALELFVVAISDEDRWEVVELLVAAWEDSQLKGWREREGVIRLLGVLVELERCPGLTAQNRDHRTQLLKVMVVRGLYDDVASVRDAAVSVVPTFMKAWKSQQPRALNQLLEDIRIMADNSKYSRRMTFVACLQQLLLQEDESESRIRDRAYWGPLEQLASDGIVGVRIGVARLLSEVCDQYYRNTKPDQILHLAKRLSQDPSKDVRSFIAPILDSATSRPELSGVQRYDPSDLPSPRTFSRPPPVLEDASVNIEWVDWACEHENSSRIAAAYSSVNDGALQMSRTTDVPRIMNLSSTLDGACKDGVRDMPSSRTPETRPSLVRTQSDHLSVFA